MVINLAPVSPSNKNVNLPKIDFFLRHMPRKMLKRAFLSLQISKFSRGVGGIPPDPPSGQRHLPRLVMKSGYGPASAVPSCLLFELASFLPFALTSRLPFALASCFPFAGNAKSEQPGSGIWFTLRRTQWLPPLCTLIVAYPLHSLVARPLHSLVASSLHSLPVASPLHFLVAYSLYSLVASSLHSIVACPLYFLVADPLHFPSCFPFAASVECFATLV